MFNPDPAVVNCGNFFVDSRHVSDAWCFVQKLRLAVLFYVEKHHPLSQFPNRIRKFRSKFTDNAGRIEAQFLFTNLMATPPLPWVTTCSSLIKSPRGGRTVLAEGDRSTVRQNHLLRSARSREKGEQKQTAAHSVIVHRRQVIVSALHFCADTFCFS